LDYYIAKKAVSKAVQDGGLWLVYGNDRVYQDAPTTIQLDAEAMLYRLPAPLNLRPISRSSINFRIARYSSANRFGCQLSRPFLPV